MMWVLVVVSLVAGALLTSGAMALLHVSRLNNMTLVQAFLSVCNRSCGWLKLQYERKGRFLAKRNNLRLSFFQRDHDRLQLKKKPLYLVMGSMRSGKTHLIKNSNQIWKNKNHLSREAKALLADDDEGEWHMSHDALFVEMALKDDSGQPVDTKRYVKMLKKRHRNRPLNGIIFTFSMPELLLAKHEMRRDFVAEFIEEVGRIYALLQVELPVYIVLTKADLVSGFVEFFSDMSKEDLSQVWGVSFPLAVGDCYLSLSKHFDASYSGMMARLSQRVLWTMDAEKSEQSRGMIFSFVQQMQLFRQPILSLLEDMLSLSANKMKIKLRGVYFTSSAQQGAPYNFFLHVISKRYSLSALPAKEQEDGGESYFSENVFAKAIIPENAIFGLSHKQSFFKKIGYRCSMCLAPLLLAFTAYALTHAYHQNTRQIQWLNNRVATYRLAMKSLPYPSMAIDETLPALNALSTADNALNHSYLSCVFFSAYRVHEQLQSALARSLHSLFLPRVAAIIETQLQQNNLSVNALYANLKGYLSFSPSHYTQSNAIKAPMLLYIHKRYDNQAHTRLQLERYLSMVSRMQIDKLPLDRPLINKVRLALQQVVPSVRAYALLTIRALASNVADITLQSVIGPTFNMVFTPTSIKPIPALYTKAGFEKIYRPDVSVIAHEVSDDNKEIGLNTVDDNSESYAHILAQLQRQYDRQYFLVWHTALKSMQINPFSTYAQAVSTLTLLAGPNSPMSHLLSIVSNNTKAIKADGVTVNKSFGAINDVSYSGFTQSKWQKVQKQFQRLSVILNTIESSAHVSSSAYQAMRDFAVDSNSPIKRLLIMAQSLPDPVSLWVKQIVKNSFSLMNQSAMAYINQQWQSQVYPFYQMHIAQHYPVSEKAKAQMSLLSFAQFFAQNGVLSAFYKNYLAQFIDQTGLIWQPLKIDGLALPISARVVKSLQQLKSIQDGYFVANKPSLSFTLKPISLDAKIRQVSLRFANQQLIYAHGPISHMQLTWPLSADNPISQIEMQDFNQHSALWQSYGPWSLFKILDQTQLVKVGASHYRMHVRMQGFSAYFDLTTDASLSVLKQKALYQFRLPKEL